MRKTLAALCGFFIACGIAQAQSGIGTLTAAGADCTTVGACVSVNFSSTDNGSASIQLSGTFNATVQFEASSDNGTTWVAISGTPLNSTTAVTSATTANTWKFNVASLTSIRARCSVFTSAPTVVIHTSKAVANAIGGGGAVFASGGTTNNVIPKSNGSSALADSSLTDTGTVVTATEPFRAADGAAAGPSYSFTNSTTTGMYQSSNVLDLVNAASSTNWMSLGSNGIQVASTQQLGWSSSTTIQGANTDTAIARVAAASVRIGLANGATPIVQALTIGESSRGGTDSNVAGANGSIKPGDGTGLGAGAKLCLQRNLMGATGSTAQTQIEGYCVGPSKTLSNTSATAQSLANISVPSNSAGGVTGSITITCTDGTNFDAETQSFNTSYVNKAGTLTVTAPVITATSAANNSGSCTAGITAVAGTNSVDIKVTPVLSTIVPTNVTSYIELAIHGTGAVTFN